MIAAAGAAHTLGIGTPGAISPRTGLLKNAPNTACLIGRPFAADLRARLGRGFAIENDANCFAPAEPRALRPVAVLIGQRAIGAKVFRK